MRNFQPPVDGSEIIMAFGIQPGVEVGIIKNAIREAIIEGIIPNEHEAARRLMIREGKGNRTNTSRCHYRIQDPEELANGH